MTMPTDIGVIDLMIATPFRAGARTYQFLRQSLRDRESLDEFEFPAQYMFKDVPHPEAGDDPVRFLLEQMDRSASRRACSASRSPRIAAATRCGR